MILIQHLSMSISYQKRKYNSNNNIFGRFSTLVVYTFVYEKL